jgi:hypothetical protein
VKSRLAAVCLAFALPAACAAHAAAPKKAPPKKAPKVVGLWLRVDRTEWSPPKPGTRTESVATLSIGNGTQTDHWFNLAATVGMSLRDAAGKEVPGLKRSVDIGVLSPIFVRAGKARMLHYQVALATPRGGGDPTLTISNLRGGEWRFRGVAPGRYTLTAGYANLQPRLGRLYWAVKNWAGVTAKTPLWVGRLAASPVTLTIGTPPGSPPAGD